MKKFIFAALLLAGMVAFMAPPQAFAEDEKPFTIHGEVRSRGEYNNNVDDLHDSQNPTATEPGFDDGALFFPYRVRIAAEGHFTKNVSGWIEFQNTGSWGDDFGGPRHVGDFSSDTKMYQGNITLNHLWSKSFSLKLGRQEIVAGNELMLGDEDFYGGISHDGAVGNWGLKSFNVMAWWTRSRQDGVFGFSGAGDVTPDQIDWAGNAADLNNRDFWGGYLTWNFKKNQVVDVYLMNLDDRGVGARVDTIGARYAHDDRTKTSFYWNVEVAQQFGSASTASITGAPQDVDASGMVVEGWFGFNWKMAKNVHRFYGRYEMASGNDATKTDKNEGFIQQFGENHNRLGHGDWFQLNGSPGGIASGNLSVCNTTATSANSATVDSGCGSGIQAYSVGYNGFYNDRHELGVAFWNYTLDQAADVDPTAGVQNEDALGTAWDLWYGFNFSKNVSFEASYSELSPGKAIKNNPGSLLAGFDATGSNSVQRLYGQIRLRF